MKKFWNWYHKNYALNLTVATILFSLQVVHLFWLFAHIILPKLGGQDLFEHLKFLTWPLILIDYTEIPAIITTSLVYIHEIREKHNIKSWLFLFFINVQWVHLFWITDEFVIQNYYFSGVLWWTAIAIDYLELPVIIDTVKKLIASIKKGDVKLALSALQE
jgi:hypothetical protein